MVGAPAALPVGVPVVDSAQAAAAPAAAAAAPALAAALPPQAPPAAPVDPMHVDVVSLAPPPASLPPEMPMPTAQSLPLTTLPPAGALGVSFLNKFVLLQHASNFMLLRCCWIRRMRATYHSQLHLAEIDLFMIETTMLVLPTTAAGQSPDGGANGKKRGRPRQDGSWASDRQRTDVKRGKFSEKEKDTIRSAVKECAAFASLHALRNQHLARIVCTVACAAMHALGMLEDDRSSFRYSMPLKCMVSAPPDARTQCTVSLTRERLPVDRYAAAHAQSQDDLTWLFKSRTTPGVYSAASGGAWQQIAKALPDRTTQQARLLRYEATLGNPAHSD